MARREDMQYVQDTSEPMRQTVYDQSPPQTPPPKSARLKGKGVAKAAHSRPSVRDAFPEDYARNLESENRRRSNSHDLSWSPRNTRASVVDNMLLSLDQLADNGPLLQNANTAVTANDENPGNRSHKHTFSSSISSDYSIHVESPATNLQTRGNRSNSNSTFQSSLGRIDSVRGVPPDVLKLAREVVYEGQTAAGQSGSGSSGGASTRARKGSKSSGSSSVDIGQMMGGSTWQRSKQRRSSSFDHGSSSRTAYPFDSGLYSAMPQPVDAQMLAYDSYEAAPTPTVHSGPRRNRSPPLELIPPQILRPITKPLQSPITKNAPASHSYRNSRSNTFEVEGRGARRHTASNSRDIPAPSQFNLAEKSPLIANMNTSVPPTPGSANPKEKQGFFRRVFGSSRNATPPAIELPPPQPISSWPNTARSDSRNGQFSVGPHSGRSLKTPPANSQPKAPAREGPPPAMLNKKTSFFRRRKKSISESMPPMPAPAQQPQPQDHSQERFHLPEADPKSPSSSLRQVMNPYLNSSPVRGQMNRMNMNGPDEYDEGRNAVFASYEQSTIQRAMPDQVDQREAIGYEMPPSMPNRESSSRGKPIVGSAPTSARPNLQKLDTDARQTTPKQTTSQSASPKNKERSTLMGSPMASDFPSIIPRRTSSDTPRARATHSRGNSDRKSPSSEKPLALRDMNLPQPKYVETPSRTSSRDWHNTDISPTKAKFVTAPSSAVVPSSPRFWLEPERSEEEIGNSGNLMIPQGSVCSSRRASETSLGGYKTAESKLASPIIETHPVKDNATTDNQIEETKHEENKVEKSQPEDNVVTSAAATTTDEEIDVTSPTTADQDVAQKLYDDESDIVDRDGAAAWLGEEGVDRARIRQAYMKIFDWNHKNILAALRDLCGHLILKGETQQVDRILDAFSVQWCHCNPNHGFKATDVVHTICYSILLLNTDLHMADIEQKMTRNQFIKNTMPTIRRVVADAAPGAFERGSMLPPPHPKPSMEAERPGFLSEPKEPPPRSATYPSEEGSKQFLDIRRAANRLSSRPTDLASGEGSWRRVPTALDYDTPVDDCGPLVKAPFYGKMSTWEVQVEIVLKDFYNSIRQQRLPLYGSEDASRSPEPPQISLSLSAMTGNMLRRTPSMLSKAGSESQTTRGRYDNRMGSRWSSKTRSRPRLYPQSLALSSRTSFDDESSAPSPSTASMWSKYSFGKTQTSMSVNSFASSFPQGDYQQSIGFANALSQAIIREDASINNTVEETLLRAAPLLEDESLGLVGAPWAKEGILKHKHHLESVDKKAKERNWSECFGVIDKGWMRLFQFNMNAKSMRQKMKNQKLAGGVVGGGNWTENAEALGKFLLRQTIASALPPPGYSKTRPHVWALSLPTGAVHLFQVGTPEIVREFVSSANYWSARLSKEPLVGGISNIEYGWSDAVINISAVGETRASSVSNHQSRPSLQNSIRSSLDQGNLRPKLPGDRITIHDWTPPQQSMMASALMEVDQLRALTTYVKNVENELQKHNELRSAMLLAFTPRHPTHNKAMSNWERKSSYLLREIVKFRTYIDCLNAAQTQKEKVYAERDAFTKERESFAADAEATAAATTL